MSTKLMTPDCSNCIAPSPALIELVHRRWSIPVLALLFEGTTGVPGRSGGGARFVTLSRLAGVGAESLRRTLTALIDQGWVERNPGHGHPLRPEYVLSSTGHAAARACAALMNEIRSNGIDEIALRKWSIPVMLVLNHRGRRFQEMRHVLPGVTPRALAQTLKTLEEARLLDRSILDAYPPRPVYSLTAVGRQIAEPAEALQEALGG